MKTEFSIADGIGCIKYRQGSNKKSLIYTIRDFHDYEYKN
jgi:hypothetical protein